MLNRETCTWLKEVGLPQELSQGDWYYHCKKNDLYVWGVSWHTAVHIKCPTPCDLEAFAIEKAREEWPGLGWLFLVIYIPEDQVWEASIDFDIDNRLLATGASTKSDALVSLIRKLVELEGVKE